MDKFLSYLNRISEQWVPQVKNELREIHISFYSFMLYCLFMSNPPILVSQFDHFFWVSSFLSCYNSTFINEFLKWLSKELGNGVFVFFFFYFSMILCPHVSGFNSATGTLCSCLCSVHSLLCSCSSVFLLFVYISPHCRIETLSFSVFSKH